MKIALITAYFYPTSNGGTEKYVYDLAKKLNDEGNDIQIITSNINSKIKYTFENLRVINLIEEENQIKEFEQILIKNNFDRIHFHTLTPAFGVAHINIARSHTKELFFTAHIPGITCVQGNLIQNNKKSCNGFIDYNKCTSCYLVKKGLPVLPSKFLAPLINLTHFPKSTFKLVHNKKKELRILNNLCDQIFLFTNWQMQIYLANGFHKNKLILTNQILDKTLLPQNIEHKTIKNLGFVGRISEEKGLHILIKAFINSNRQDLILNIAGIQNDLVYFNKLQKLTENYPNIIWQLNIDQANIKNFYKQINALVISSVILETGPFVLYEAIENNLPIIANNLGDIKIWKEKGFNIELYNNEVELTSILKKLGNKI